MILAIPYQKNSAKPGIGFSLMVLCVIWYAEVSYSNWRELDILSFLPEELCPTIRLLIERTHEKLYNSLIFQYHYLGYSHPVGEHLKYLVFADGRVIACLAFCSSPRHIGCRDKFIGWCAEVRKKNLHLIAYNTRYLILPFNFLR